MGRLTPVHSIESSSREFLLSELDDTKVLLSNVTSAIDELAKNKIQSYNLDTGQTTQRVTYNDLDMLFKWRDRLIYHITRLEAYLGISRSSVQVRPGW